MLPRYRPRTFALELLMIFVALLFAYPVYVLVNLSLKTPHEIAEASIGPPSHLETSNYSNAWNGAHLGAAMLNSTIITVASLVGLIMIGSTAAYYLARTHSKLSYGMYLLFLLGIVLPFQLALVPLYRFMQDAGLLGSYTSMVLFYTGLQIPFTIFLYSGFLRALPREYGEAALVDGANHWQSFTRVTFPLLRPVTGTVIILNAVFIWNDFLTPLIYLGGTPNETLPVVVYQFVGQYVSNWGYIFAAVVMASLPILVVFLLLQRYVIRGFTSGLKG
jgi:raffinose/stachyose/melibiose transport system permease protein